MPMRQSHDKQRYQGPDRRRSQKQYQGEERRKRAAATGMGGEEHRGDEEQGSRAEQPRFDDIH